MSPERINLKNDYLDGKIIPFIGAGLSIPFKVPNWRELIEEITRIYAVDNRKFLLESVKILLDRNDYWGAIDQLKEFANIDDQDVQGLVENIIEKRQIEINDDTMHNYKDIGQMNFDLYLTTNYEELVYKYLDIKTVPMLLKDIDFNTQTLFDKKRVLHLHGYLTNPKSIVISKSSYKELYENNKYKNLLKVITGTKKLMFIGFSFDDQFIQQLIIDHKEFFNGQHYIILDNPQDEKVRELKNKYGLITIRYDSRKSNHSEEIRKILNEIESGYKEMESKSTQKLDTVDKNKVFKITDNVIMIENAEKVKIAKEIKRLLIENHRIFIEYGPNSDKAISNPLSNNYTIWEIKKVEKIVPNNAMIVNLINENKQLFDMDEYDACFEFIEHADIFEKSCYSIIEDAKQFPIRFEEVINKYAKI